MTIITKAISEKKASDKKEQPLFVEETAADSSKSDVEAQTQKPDVGRHYFAARRNIHRIHVTATFLLFLMALMILIIGVIGGLYIYIQYARAQIHRCCTGWYSIPYDKTPYSSDSMHQAIIADSNLFKNFARGSEPEEMDLQNNLDNNKSFLKEHFEIDLENEHYEKIDVPDFRGGRQGRFIHDFSINKTGIIDIDGQCCFVMPLNRQRVLPPHNLYDLLRKMFNGYYEVDTDIVRETMKVVIPPITDMSTVGTYIARECQDFPTYMLRKVNHTVVKRSASSGIFAQFAGKDIIEVDILNLNEFHK
ncbi:PREDICTED: integral membrane protein 2C [Polistes dominula]|uniref:Integral membrane protein 2 n=1 Tax=Polistes dominula TaxID=743375 RepID=A0ABM1J0B4_POLDO|nr:PREDICTED: integral membrane protein 2C [Polistes dominula]